MRRVAAESRAIERAGVRAESVDGAMTAVVDRDEINRAMTVLSPVEREAIALRFGADLTVPEMARVLHEPLALDHPLPVMSVVELADGIMRGMRVPVGPRNVGA